jgi:NADH-quinone oxidoreductase subunit M
VHSSLFISALLLLPVLGAVLARWQRAVEGRAYAIAVATAGLEFVLTLVVAVLYKSSLANAQGFDFAYRHVLSAPLGLAYDVAIDGISLWLVVLTALTVLVALLGARDRRRESSYVAWQLLLLSVTMGCFVAHDLVEFFVFFELILVPCYFMITQWGGAQRKAAAMKFFLYTFTGSAFMLVSIIYLAMAHQRQAGGALTFAYGALSQTTLSTSAALWVFAGFAVAFAVKSPVWPLHTWSPSTYAEAPTAAGIELSALLSKLGSYGLLRFAVGLLPGALADARPVLLTLAVISILYGSFVACTARDLRRFIAYSSLAQMGFVTLGVMSGSLIGTEGAVLLMVNHGIITLGVFVLVGYLERRGSSVALADLRGLQGPMPVLAGIFTVFMLATMGLPGLNGFVSEYLILIGTFAVHTWWALAATLGVVGSAVYWLWAYQRAFHGTVSERDAALPDLSRSERNLVIPIVALVVALGVFPSPVLSRISPAVQFLITHVAPTGVSK